MTRGRAVFERYGTLIVGWTVVAVVALLVMVGCTNVEGVTQDDHTTGTVVTMPDGRSIPCVVVIGVDGDGVAVSCDWGTPSPTASPSGGF